MLLLLFDVASNRYGLEASEVIEVTPIVRLRPAPHTPAYVAGVFNFRGAVTPVIDLHALLGERPVRPLLSTRIIIVRLEGPGGQERRLGLMSERVTETIACRPEDFQPPGVHTEEAAYLGDLMTSPGGLIQKVTVSRILPAEVKRLLFEQIDADGESPEPTKLEAGGEPSAPSEVEASDKPSEPTPPRARKSRAKRK